MIPPFMWSPQSLTAWDTELTAQEVKECEQHAAVVMVYRHNLPVYSPCWSDEWPLGYMCAIRDLGRLSRKQWVLLCSAFQMEEV